MEIWLCSRPWKPELFKVVFEYLRAAVHDHRAELQEPELATVPPNAALPEEDWPSRSDQDCAGDDYEDRGEQHSQEKRRSQIDGSLDQAVCGTGRAC